MDECEEITMNCMKQQMAEHMQNTETKGKKARRRGDQRGADKRMNDKSGKEERQCTSIKKNVVQPVNETGTCGLYLNLRVY